MIFWCILFLGYVACSSVKIIVESTGADDYGDLEIQMNESIVFSTKYSNFKEGVELEAVHPIPNRGLMRRIVEKLHKQFNDPMTSLRNSILVAIFENKQPPSQQEIASFYQEACRLSSSLTIRYSELIGKDVSHQRVLDCLAKFFFPKLWVRVQHVELVQQPLSGVIEPIILREYDLRMFEEIKFDIAGFHALVHFAQGLRRLSRVASE